MKSWVKLYRSVLSSSLMEQPEHVQLVFFKLLVLADWNGEVHLSDRMLRHQIHERSLDLVRDALDVLSSPDEHSRSPEEEGRRIVRLDEGVGWRIVNSERYQGPRPASESPTYERDRKRAQRQKKEKKTKKEIEIGKPGRPGTSRDTPGQGGKKKRAEREGDARLVRPDDDLDALGLWWPKALAEVGLEERHLRVRIRRQVEEQGKPKSLGAWKRELATLGKGVSSYGVNAVLDTLQAAIDRGWQGIQTTFIENAGRDGSLARLNASIGWK